MNKSGHHLGGSSTIFPIPIYSNGIENFDDIQYEINKAVEKVNFEMRPDWGHTHYLSDITFEENFIEKYKLTNFKKELTWHMNQFHQNKNFSIESSWMTVFKKYNYGHIHDHGGNDISGVYYFKTNSQGEPIFSAVKYEDEIVEGNELHKIVFEGELKQTFKKARRGKKRKK